MPDNTTDRPADETRRNPGTQGGPTAVLKGVPGFREPPEDYVAAARTAPDHWLTIVDRHWSGDEYEPPPRWAMLGRWRTDEYGEIVEWEENAEYRPSPDAYGWAPPVSPADAAARLVATGYGSEEVLALALADDELAVCLDDEGEFAVTEAPDGTSVVSVFTVAPQLDAQRLPPYALMSPADFLDRLPEGKEVLFLSSSAPVGQLITASALRSGMADLARYKAWTEATRPEPVMDDDK
jgi:hypothetical protein